MLITLIVAVLMAACVLGGWYLVEPYLIALRDGPYGLLAFLVLLPVAALGVFVLPPMFASIFRGNPPEHETPEQKRIVARLLSNRGAVGFPVEVEVQTVTGGLFNPGGTTIVTDDPNPDHAGIWEALGRAVQGGDEDENGITWVK